MNNADCQQPYNVQVDEDGGWGMGDGGWGTMRDAEGGVRGDKGCIEGVEE